MKGRAIALAAGAWTKEFDAQRSDRFLPTRRMARGWRGTPCPSFACFMRAGRKSSGANRTSAAPFLPRTITVREEHHCWPSGHHV
jgi:hypothetical protein